LILAGEAETAPSRRRRPRRRRFQEARQARSWPSSRQAQARGNRSRSFGSRDGGHGRRGESVELPPERSEQLDWRPSTLLVIVHVRKKIRPQNATFGKRPDACGAERAVARKRRGDSRRVGRSGADVASDRLQGPTSAFASAEGIFKRQGLRTRGKRWTVGGADGRIPATALRLGHSRGVASRVIHTDDTR